MRDLGNVVRLFFYTDPVDANPINQTESIKELVADMNAGKVDLLIILGGNPAYDAPADLNFAGALKSGKTPLRVHYGLYQNEPPNSVSGTSMRRMNSRPGAMPAPMTARSALSSR